MFSFCFLKKNDWGSYNRSVPGRPQSSNFCSRLLSGCKYLFSHVQLKCIHTLTIRKYIIVNRGGRRETAQLWLGVVLLQSEPLSAAVNPCSPPHCRRWALHRFSSHTAGIQQRFTTRILNCLVSNNKAIVTFYTEI